MARELGIGVIEQPVPREMLYMADEVFLTGTATEVAPVRSVDKIVVGSGNRGAVTQQLQGRQAHFKTAGQYFLGLDPDPTSI